ncbi:MAG TPA: YceI family protein [Bacteroidia bacterium]|jgi:polyisoprenoid-binding protein YceI
MKKITLLAAVALGGLLSAFTLLNDAPEWKMDPSHSSFSFTVTHLGTPVLGLFQKTDAVLKFDPADANAGSVKFTIDASSVYTGQPMRDHHLKTADFLDTAKYPVIVFQSEKFTKKNEQEYVVTGNLTVKDVTKKVDVPFTITALKDHPFSKDKMLLGLKAQTTFKRSDFHVGSGNFAGDAVVGDDVTIQLFAEFSRPK